MPRHSSSATPRFLAAVCAGATFGLVFGVSSLNRPVANAVAFYVLGVLLGAAGVLVAWAARVAVRGRAQHSAVSARAVVLRGVTALATAAVLLVTYAALVVPRQIDVRQLHVALPRLPASWQGQEVAVLSDLQVGMWGANLQTVERIVDRIVARRPAVVLLAGDLLYGTDPDPAEQTGTVLRLLQPLLDAGIETVAVLGNHDHETGYAEGLTQRLERRGMAVLENSSTAVRAHGSALHVVGLGPRRPNLDDPAAALRDVPDGAPRIVVMHNPVSFLGLPPGSAPIAFAGHTHCGQVVLPVGNGWSRLELRVDERYVIGGFAPEDYGADGNALFVTCGVGFSRVPLRLGAEPQVVFAELVED